MNQYVRLGILSDKVNKQYTIYRLLMVGVVILSIAFINIIFMFELSGDIFPPFALVMILLLTFLYLKTRVNQKYETLGELLLEEDQLTISTQDQQNVIPITSISSMMYVHNGYHNENKLPWTYNEGQRGAKDGGHNYLTFTSDIFNGEYHIFISNDMKVRILRRLLDIYESNGVEVKRKKYDTNMEERDLLGWLEYILDRMPS